MRVTVMSFKFNIVHAGCRAQNLVRLLYCTKLLNSGFFKYVDNDNVVFEKAVISCLICSDKVLSSERLIFFVRLVASFCLVSLPCIV